MALRTNYNFKFFLMKTESTGIFKNLKYCNLENDRSNRNRILIMQEILYSSFDISNEVKFWNIAQSQRHRQCLVYRFFIYFIFTYHVLLLKPAKLSVRNFTKNIFMYSIWSVTMKILYQHEFIAHYQKRLGFEVL